MSKTNHAKSSRGSEIDGKSNHASDTDTTKVSRKTASEWTQEIDVDNYVRDILEKTLKLKKDKDYYEKTGSPYMQEALKGASKTGKGGTAKIDFVVEKFVEKYDIPIVIENKFQLKFLENLDKTTPQIKTDADSVKSYALNGALHYANHLVKNKAYKEVIAVGCAGDTPQNVAFRVFYVAENNTYANTTYANLDFLATQESFDDFYQSIKLTDEQKHDFAIYKRELISKHAKNLSVIMNDFSILPHERALFVAACCWLCKTLNKMSKF